ncbi:DNA/RNA non-specific endonuclease [Aliamphritea hakodatensis]|uniref:DNA/RNA non-specific endonuclease n=1 Tax=Aliamphritea hakodatensis TaxID=2895352 RepID=UPI0022FD75E2|nr:DNA/RNA non-specific endonuclease [Aliamphritea hakodatensis]
MNLNTLKPETRYGCPAADQILYNRFFTVGYSYYFRQAKWALEIVDPGQTDMDGVTRLNNFRPDFRIPPEFRADLSDYSNSGYDRGHLVASADMDDTHVQNSETFLLSNMSPQASKLNRGKWRTLETAIRKLNQLENVVETYVITGPVFDYDSPIETVGQHDDNGVEIPIPSHFFKCILAEQLNGRLKMWAFEMPNARADGELEAYQVKTSYIERRTGIMVWNNLTGEKIEREKNTINRLWPMG